MNRNQQDLFRVPLSLRGEELREDGRNERDAVATPTDGQIDAFEGQPMPCPSGVRNYPFDENKLFSEKSIDPRNERDKLSHEFTGNPSR